MGVTLPLYRIHRHIGMGGDQLVAALAGDDFEREHGDDVRAAEGELYMELIERGRARSPARASCSSELRERGHAVVLASSAKPHEVDHYLDLLDARELADGWTTSADVERTKPEPDLVEAAVEKAGGGAGRDGRRLDVGLRGGRARRDPDRSACSPAASRSGSCATPAPPACSSGLDDAARRAGRDRPPDRLSQSADGAARVGVTAAEHC